MMDNPSSPLDADRLAGSGALEPSATQSALERLESRLARTEAQVLALQEGVGDLNRFAAAARQRSLYLRIGILLALLLALFVTHLLKP
jgi:hypothetical protein